jgi:hypothetical protein
MLFRVASDKPPMEPRIRLIALHLTQLHLHNTSEGITSRLNHLRGRGSISNRPRAIWLRGLLRRPRIFITKILQLRNNRIECLQMFGAQTVSKGGEKKLIETWGGIRI